MSATTMHFGPEWMRTKHQPLTRSQPPPSPPPSNPITASGVSTYSALVSATPPASSEASDDVHPFRYSKEELIRIYQEGGGKGGLGLEVERWEGVVREAGGEPIALREMTEMEKKLFAGPLNSELRRRPSQSTDFLSPLNTSALERPRLTHSVSATSNSPLRERFGALKRRDSGANGPSDTPLSTLPRKPSLSALQAPLLSPRDMSPRTRVGYTPNFDGVLNNGESWTARRRISESSLKAAAAATATTPGRDGGDHSTKALGIREEKEDEQNNGSRSHHGDNQNVFASSSPHLRSEEPQQYEAVGGVLDSSSNGTQTGPFGINGTSNTTLFGNNHANVGPPPGLIDLAAVEWSYKDPSGQVQGPFRADLMQKWYNDGYFSLDLPMRRVLYDAHWTTVEELKQRANGENIFLTPLVTANPNTNRGNGSPMQSYPSLDNAYNEPYQPSPMRTLRTSTLESYLGAGSLPSDSPSSSVGASHFGNPSPDPAAFGGREAKAYFGNEHLVSRLPAFGAQDHIPPFPDRRPILEYPNNGVNLHQAPSFGNFVSERDMNFNNGYGFNPAPMPHDPWMMGSNNIASPVYAGGREHAGRTENMHHDPAGRAFNTDGIYGNDNLGGFATNIPGSNEMHHRYGQYELSGQPAFQNMQQDQPQMISNTRDLVENSPQLNPLPGFRNLNIDSTPTKSPRSANVNATFSPAPIQSPWKPLPGLSTPSTSHVIVPALLPLWTSEPNTLPTPIPNEAVVETPSLAQDVGPTSSNVPMNEAEMAAESQNVPKTKKAASPPVKKVHSPHPSDSVPVSEPSASLPTLVTAKATTKLPAPVTPPVVAVEAPITPTAPKLAWAKEEEGKKKKSSAPSVSLRDIQEAEAKKLESRKAAEREKEKLARVSTSAETKEDMQSFTTSWGLPSQTGSRGSGSGREVATPAVQTPAAAVPVWTTPVKQPVAKKTMKEIQEEEETRKKLAAKEVATPVAVKRGYAESTTKVTGLPPVSATNNVWTTVGPSGKTQAPVVPSPVRSVAQPTTAVPTPGVPALSRASSSPVPRNIANSALKTRPVATKSEDVSDVPSHDFLKWLSDSLKGLNSSVNVEEIMSMLLSFPLEPDATTIEIISDTIYSNSTTLDGRRFASEFVAKRKADARSKASSASGKAKPVSIADVVKAAPKATQQEWGFKVVNKKKKGGRS